MSPSLSTGRSSIESTSRRGGPGLGFLLLSTSLPGAAVFVAHRLRTTDLLRWVGGIHWWDTPFDSSTLTTAAAALLALPAIALAARPWHAFALAAALPACVALLLSRGPLPSPLEAPPALLRLLADPRTRALALPVATEAGAAAAGLLAAGAVLRRSAQGGRGPAEIAHGTARLATTHDLHAADLLSGEGVVLASRRSALGVRPITDRSADHLLVVMPPGGGKTTGPVAGALLNVDTSALVLDPKGELWNLSAGWRQSCGGHVVVRFAPHTASTLCWNPLDEIERGPGEIAAISAVADNLITYPADHGDNHWTSSARSLLRCLMLHVLYKQRRPTFAAVRDLLMSRTDLDVLFKSLAKAVHDEDGRYGWQDADGNAVKTHPEVARLARIFAATPDRERGSIVSTLGRFLDLWGDPRIQASTGHSNWSLDLLTDPDRRATVYVTVPTSQLGRVAPLVRVLLALLTHRVTADSGSFHDREAAGDRRLLLVLDEFAALGRLPILEDMLAFLRGYGVRALIAVQDLSQLRRNYGPHHAIAATCRLHVAASSTDVATRHEISRRLGDATHVYTKRSRSGRLLDARRTVSQAEVRRPLLTEGEIGTLPHDRLVIVKAGHPPLLASKLPYWRHPELRRRAGMSAPGRENVLEALQRNRTAGEEPS